MTTFIEEQLQSVPGPKRRSCPNSTFILCPFHSEKTPSARVFHDNGYLRCYGCGASKPYKVWSKEYSLSKMGKDRLPESGEVPKTGFLSRLLNGDSDATTEKHPDLSDIRLHDIRSDLGKSVGVYRKWRGFTSSFLSENIRARLAYSESRNRHYIWLPVWVRGRLRGFILAQLRKPTDKSVPSYLNSPGKWSLRYGLFPLDYAVFVMSSTGCTTIVVVEGPRDALRLCSMGIPAVSMLGTHSWTDTKSRLLELCGVSRVVLMLDGDEAGKKATRFLKTGKKSPKDEPSIKPISTWFKVVTVRLWLLTPPEDFPEASYDPGNMPDPLIKELILPLLK